MNEKLRESQEKLRATLYFAHMNLIKHVWEEGAVSRVHELLDEHHPKPGQSDIRGFEWYYFNRLVNERPQKSWNVHDAMPVNWIAYSPDGTRMASCTSGGSTSSASGVRRVYKPELKIWDTATGALLSTIEGGYAVDDGDSSFAFSSDNRRLAFPTQTWDASKREYKDVSVKIWDIQENRQLHELQGHSGAVASLCFSSDGKLLASGSRGHIQSGKPGEVIVWDVPSGNKLYTLQGSTDGARSVAFSPDGKQLVGGSHGRGKLWETSTGKEITILRLNGQVGPYTSFAFSPDSKWVVSSGRLTIWEVPSGKEIKVFDKKGPSVSFSPDGRYLAQGTFDGSSEILDTESGEHLRSCKGRQNDYVFSVAYSPDGRRLAGVLKVET